MLFIPCSLIRNTFLKYIFFIFFFQQLGPIFFWDIKNLARLSWICACYHCYFIFLLSFRFFQSQKKLPCFVLYLLNGSPQTYVWITSIQKPVCQMITYVLEFINCWAVLFCFHDIPCWYCSSFQENVIMSQTFTDSFNNLNT